jgi:hypothetical protein
MLIAPGDEALCCIVNEDARWRAIVQSGLLYTSLIPGNLLGA